LDVRCSLNPHTEWELPSREGAVSLGNRHVGDLEGPPYAVIFHSVGRLRKVHQRPAELNSTWTGFIQEDYGFDI